MALQRIPRLVAGKQKTVPVGDSESLAEKDFLQAGYRYALALAHHHQDAEDLVQQAWLKLYRRYGGVEDLPLLFTAIRNLFFDQLQRKIRLHFVSLEGIQESDMTQSPKSGTGASLTRVDLERLLGNLKAKEREVLFFHYVQGYTGAEIGQLTGQPRGTVLSLLRRSKQKLSAMFNEKTDTAKLQETSAGR